LFAELFARDFPTAWLHLVGVIPPGDWRDVVKGLAKALAVLAQNGPAIGVSASTEMIL
jgi:hypothetical protein